MCFALLFWHLFIFVNQAEHTEIFFVCVSSSFLLMASYLAGDSSALIMNKLKCPHCNYVAKYRRTLKRHLLIHTGVRSFSCDICGKLFTRREHVKRHSLVGNLKSSCICMHMYEWGFVGFFRYFGSWKKLFSDLT